MKPPTEMQNKFVDGKLNGLSDNAASVQAGGCGRSAQVKEALAKARAEIEDITTLSRMDVIDGIMDAVSLARVMSEPATMIQGYDKLAKILGYYAPEVKEIRLTTNQQVLRSKYEVMSDEELLAKIEGRLTLDGIFTQVSH